MADPAIYSASARQLAALVLLRWGDPGWPAAHTPNWPEGGSLRVTDWGEPITFNGRVYAPLEAMEITLPEMQGGAEDSPFRIRFPVSIEPFARTFELGNPRLEAMVYEIDPADPVSARLIARGDADPSSRHPDGAPGCIDIPFAGVRSQMEVALGLVAEPFCPHTLGDEHCGKDLAELIFVERATAVSGRTITTGVLATRPNVTVGGAPTMLPIGWARFGRVSIGGLTIPIIDHDNVTGVATLRDEPPAHWLDRYVTIVAGCNKLHHYCSQTMDNLDNFGGIGVAIPSYSPLVNDRP